MSGYPDDWEDEKARRICLHCVGESFLKEEITLHGLRRKCFYCHQIAKTISIGQLTDRVENAFKRFYERTPDEMTPWEEFRQREFGDIWYRDGQPVKEAIEEAAVIPPKAARDIQSILKDKFDNYDPDGFQSEAEFADDSYYDARKVDDEVWQGLWTEFERSLKTENRLFNGQARAILESIFSDLHSLKTFRGEHVVVDAGPSTEIQLLYRARTFFSDKDLQTALADPNKQLGPPPPRFASAGRMNGRGIAVFYGADSPDVAICEVRPPVGSKAAVAAFQLLRPLKLLDLEALESIRDAGSIFDSTELARRQRVVFLRNLNALLTKPVMPGDEPLEYLTTQAVADFLSDGMTPGIDGIRFSSVQSGGKGKNVVLFHKSSSVEAVQRPLGTKVTVGLRFEDPMEEVSWDYTIREEFPAKRVDGQKEGAGMSKDSEPVPTLRIDMDTIHIHEIKAVQFQKDEYRVDRMVSIEGEDDLDARSLLGER